MFKYYIWGYQYNLHSDLQQLPELKFWALENPNMGMLKWFLGNPNYVFDPYEFGDMYKKTTGLWGYFNPPIKTNKIKPDIQKFDGLYWDQMQELKGKVSGTNQRQVLRSITPPLFAQAFFKANP